MTEKKSDVANGGGEDLLILTPKNTLAMISEIWAFVSVDPSDGNEGVLGAYLGSTFIPLIAGDVSLLETLRPIAQRVARESGMKVRLVKFTERIVVEDAI